MALSARLTEHVCACACVCVLVCSFIDLHTICICFGVCLRVCVCVYRDVKR